MFPKISTIINFCSNDSIFLKHCVKSVIPFSQEIIVSYCDHFFDGTPENSELTIYSVNDNSEAQFICFPHSDVKDKPNYGLMHNYNRAVGWQALSKPVDWILFLDCDEVADPLFYKWLEEFDINQIDSYRILSYWYFREFKFQAIQHEDSAVLTRNKDFTFDKIAMSSGERLGLLHPNQCHNKGYGGLNLPMFHHFSWVGSKERLLRKVKSWGHSDNRNWPEMIENNFKSEFTKYSQDPVHGYSYLEVNPIE